MSSCTTHHAHNLWCHKQSNDDKAAGADGAEDREWDSAGPETPAKALPEGSPAVDRDVTDDAASQGVRICMISRIRWLPLAHSV